MMDVYLNLRAKKQFIPSSNLSFTFSLKSPSFFYINNIVHCFLLVFNNFSKIISEIKIARMEITIDIRVNLKAIASPLGICKNVYIAAEIVWVSPGIFDTNVIVAPNSPKDLSKT